MVRERPEGQERYFDRGLDIADGDLTHLDWLLNTNLLSWNCSFKVRWSARMHRARRHKIDAGLQKG